MDASLVNLVAHALLIAGAALLVTSLAPLRLIIAHLPPGTTLRTWYWLAIFDLGFIAAYAGYAATRWGEHDGLGTLLVPAVFFAGGCFVWVTFRIALRTVRDVRRIALLEQENITDHLTGVYNRRYLDRRLDEEFARARRHVQPLSVLMVDIDHFKRVNDSHGHATGDLALGHVGHLVLNTARSTDIVARYGGEELLVIAPGTTPSQALVLAERLRRRIETQVLEIERAPNERISLQLTVSVGVAALEWDMAGPAQLVEAADRAMYRAKAAGRNRVGIDRGGREPLTAAAAPTALTEA
jgi:diguanylate cyclase (GGDEF)-like protein